MVASICYKIYLQTGHLTILHACGGLGVRILAAADLELYARRHNHLNGPFPRANVSVYILRTSPALVDVVTGE